MLRANILLFTDKQVKNVIKFNKLQTANLSSGMTSRGTEINQLDFLLRRKLIENVYPESPEYTSKLNNMLKEPCSIYAGFDATSDSLHVGNLVTIMNLLHLRSFGHRVICVIGDATTKVGDPSGHTNDRLKIDHDDIVRNSASFDKLIKRIFTNHERLFCKVNNTKKLIDPVIVRNSNWYSEKNVVDFVSDVFRQFRVGSLLHKKSISERLKSHKGINMAEFSYQIFQAYDWLMLKKLYNCKIQIGGSDQAGNIYSGHDFIKKHTGQTDSIGLLTPLITNSSGKKLGKSTNKQGHKSNIWLDRDKTSPFELYQFFHRTPDSEVEKFLRIFTFHDEKVIDDLIDDNLKKSLNAWYCQKKLADDVCKLIHGEDGLESARKITQAIFHSQ